MIRFPRQLLCLVFIIGTLSSINATAQFGDLLKNIKQAGQGAANLGGFGRDIQAFIDGIKSITEVSVDATPQSSAPVGESSQDKVVLYTTATCGYCKLAMKHVRDNQIPHIEKNINTNQNYATEFKRLGGNGVPHILFGTTVMRGFSTTGFDKQYALWNASKAPADAPGSVEVKKPVTP